MRKLYAYFSMPLTAQTETNMRQYLENDPKKKEYGSHKYTLEGFGITVEDLKREFSEFIELMSGITSVNNIV